jgi:hypothetical protein
VRGLLLHVMKADIRIQHGQPTSILDIGETALDEQIFEEYIEEMRGHYTADKVCSL